jgi:hypothetical protein
MEQRLRSDALLLTPTALRWWGFKAQMFSPQLNLIRITNDQ